MYIAPPIFTINNLCVPILLTGVLWSLIFLLLPADALAVTVASQTQAFSDQLITNKALQELGNNLSGTLSTFTFRVSTARTNSNQFNFVVQNSRIFDKDNNNSSIIPCTASNYNPQDPLDGITFNTNGVPAGFEDVTLDFSCRNYQFIPGHRYLIAFGSGNFNSGSGLMLLAGAAYGTGGNGGSTDLFTLGGTRYSNGNKYDTSNNSGVCSGIYYTWGSTSPYHNGCYVWSSSNDDLYFVLTNNAPPPPPPKLPVVFIPGIGGSELKASQDIIWSKDDGHNGTYSHAYAANEKVWVNDAEASKLGDDDYFDVLKLKPDGVTSEADLSLTGNLTSSGYGDIDSFFTDIGYVKGTNFFVFAYDWRKDVRENKDTLDALIEQAKVSSGQSKVNLVAHSMGGLIARYYISDSQKATKVNKLIELGVPHLGAVNGLKIIMYGKALGRPLFGNFILGVSASEIRDVSQNLPSAFQLLPFNQYFNFYNNSDNDHPNPFRDDRDIDNNKVTGLLNFGQTKSLLSNLNQNMTVFGIGEQFHSNIDSIYNQTNGVKIYNIVGSNQPTLGQIHETWWITWPINLIPKTDEIYINGDDTVPLLSASLKSNSLDLSGDATLYFVEQKHSDLVSKSGIAMQTVKAILNDDNTLPVEVKSEKFDLEGYQISLDDGELDLYDSDKHTGINDNGEIEENIPDTFYSTSGKTKHAFVKKKAKKVVVKTTRKKPQTLAKKTNLKIRTYKQDKITKTTLYKDIPLTETSKAEFILDPSSDVSPSLVFYADETKSDNVNINFSGEATGSAALDQTSPLTSFQISGTKDSSGIYSGSVTITLTGSDSGSGILRIEYSLDNGQTVQTYTDPFTVSASGKTTIQFKSIDNLGNEEIPQIITIEIAPVPTPTPTPTASATGSSNSETSSTSSNNTSTSSSTSLTSSGDTTTVIARSEATSQSLLSPPAVLGIEFENPSHISDEINVSHVLDEFKNPEISKIKTDPAKQILGGLLKVSGGIITIAGLGFAATFIKPIPK